MKDRNVQHASRFRLTKVPGTDDVYDLIPAPGEVYDEGTLINKSALLKDTTAALFGLDENAVPDDALALLSRFNSWLGNEYVWEKYEHRIVLIDTTYKGAFAFTSYTSIKYSSEITTDDNGNFSLVNPQEFNITLDNAGMSQLISFAPCYFTSNASSAMYYLPDGSNYGTTSDKTIYLRDAYNMGFGENATVKAKTPTFSDFFVGYVNSPKPNAYPPSVYDGYTYTALGQLGSKVRIETGSYTGTGTYGSSNPNSLTFGFVPKLIFIFVSPSSAGTGDNAIIPAISLTNSYLNGGYLYGSLRNGSNRYAKIDGNTVSWYYTDGESSQMNYSGWKYNYIAIG